MQGHLECGRVSRNLCLVTPDILGRPGRSLSALQDIESINKEWCKWAECHQGGIKSIRLVPLDYGVGISRRQGQV